MAMIENSTVTLVGLALDATMLRHQAIAQNIANVNTPGYRPVGVRFEEQLAAARDALAQSGSGAPVSLAEFRPTLEVLESNRVGEGTVLLDMEMAKLSENTLHHQTLLKALNRHFSILNAAINEGKR